MTSDLAPEEYRALGDFRRQIRLFLHFSEQAAKTHGLEPQQHQMLLAIRSLAEPGGSAIGCLAANLLIQPHSAVGLVDRLEAHGLVERNRGRDDRRQVRVLLTEKGAHLLRQLSDAHREELRRAGPKLIEALTSVINSHDANPEVLR